jgi:hypothetical protein
MSHEVLVAPDSLRSFPSQPTPLKTLSGQTPYPPTGKQGLWRDTSLY